MERVELGAVGPFPKLSKLGLGLGLVAHVPEAQEGEMLAQGHPSEEVAF